MASEESERGLGGDCITHPEAALPFPRLRGAVAGVFECVEAAGEAAARVCDDLTAFDHTRLSHDAAKSAVVLGPLMSLKASQDGLRQWLKMGSDIHHIISVPISARVFILGTITSAM